MSVTLKRRQFMRSALAAIPAAALPFGKLFAAADVAVIDDVEAVTGEGKQIILKGTDVKDFAASLRGDLLLRNSAGYDTARRAWNGAFDRHPALIARCSGPADVMAAVKFAASNQLLLDTITNSRVTSNNQFDLLINGVNSFTNRYEMIAGESAPLGVTPG